jgi:alkylation response protein AidB-like acyl-CoA dehydrogenase
MLDLLLNDDQRLIAETVRTFLLSEMPLDRLRRGAKPADAAAVRAAMGALGWFGVGLPANAGGSGLGLAGEIVVQRECGRQLVSPSVLATTLAVHVAHHAGDAALRDMLMGGHAPVALALLSPADESAAQLFDWEDAGLVLAWNETGMGLFAADALADVREEAGLDDSLSLHAARLRLGEARAWLPSQRVNLALRAEVLLSAALAGLAENACDITVEYVKLREQFGRPIGAFQAVKHRCADMALRWRASWYQTCLACLKVEAESEDMIFQAASAKYVAAHAAHENGRAAIQLHGGIGFQSECDVHWFMKRAHLYDQAGGAMPLQARRLIAQPAPAR